MAGSLLSSSSEIIVRALSLESEGKLTQTFVCCEEGIGLLLKCLKCESGNGRKVYLRTEIVEKNHGLHFTRRRNKGKHPAKAKRSPLESLSIYVACKYHEHIDIAADETGYGYCKLFSRFLDDGKVTCVNVDDPYTRNSFQIEKFSHFCEVLVGSASPVRRIILQTGVDCAVSFALRHIAHLKVFRPGANWLFIHFFTSVFPGRASTFWHDRRAMPKTSQLLNYVSKKPKEQLKKFETRKQDLQLRKVDFTWNFSSLLHDRQIRFNNGWVVKIGRGLDYIKNAPCKFVGLGVHDFDFRPCLQTTIDIFYEAEPPI